MKIRPLPDIDLARIASLPEENQRKHLEKMRDGRPPFTYRPLKACFHDIFNIQPQMFDLAPPTEWSTVEKNIRKKCKTDDEIKANLAVGRGLYDFSINAKLLGRKEDFFSLSISTGQHVSYWLPMVLAYDGRPTVSFIDPRQTKSLTRSARQFVFSMMHEHIRSSDPDYENVRLVIFQFSKFNEGTRTPIVHTDDDVELICLENLEKMIQFTCNLWQDVCLERQTETRRKAVGGGSLI